jgi:hypothetical protein
MNWLTTEELLFFLRLAEDSRGDLAENEDSVT